MISEARSSPVHTVTVMRSLHRADLNDTSYCNITTFALPDKGYHPIPKQHSQKMFHAIEHLDTTGWILIAPLHVCACSYMESIASTHGSCDGRRRYMGDHLSAKLLTGSRKEYAKRILSTTLLRSTCVASTGSVISTACADTKLVRVVPQKLYPVFGLDAQVWLGSTIA